MVEESVSHECICKPRVNKDADGFWLKPLYVCLTCNGAYVDPERKKQWDLAHPKKEKARKKK